MSGVNHHQSRGQVVAKRGKCHASLS